MQIKKSPFFIETIFKISSSGLVALAFDFSEIVEIQKICLQIAR